jgi:N-formylglutamate amidohydrolase
VHALQLEKVQCCYMDETAPFAYRTDRAGKLQPLLQRMLNAVVETRP